jgi:hypothetical protein
LMPSDPALPPVSPVRARDVDGHDGVVGVDVQGEGGRDRPRGRLAASCTTGGRRDAAPIGSSRGAPDRGRGARLGGW